MTRILVIEDADPLRNDIVEMLTFEGYDVASAQDGVQGVAAALDYKPDLIICDIMMPRLDGYGVLNAVREDEDLVTVPFIFLTAKTDRTDIRHGMDLGADDYLTKPFVASELLESIKARLDKRKTFDHMARVRIKNLSDNIITALPHELRTPLNTIMGFSDMLITEAHHIPKDQVIEWAKHINAAGKRLFRLVENYLVYVRTETISHDEEELAVLKSRRLDHPGATIHVHTVLKAQQANRENDVQLNLPADVVVRISDVDMGKIVEEIVDNAVKFSEDGTPITVTAAVEDHYYVLRVRDHGRGMTPEQIGAIGVYVQFNRWLYEQQGSGLGLAIVRRLVDLYDGLLNIENEPDGGVRITVKLLADSGDQPESEST